MKLKNGYNPIKYGSIVIFLRRFRVKYFIFVSCI